MSFYVPTREGSVGRARYWKKSVGPAGAPQFCVQEHLDGSCLLADVFQQQPITFWPHPSFKGDGDRSLHTDHLWLILVSDQLM